MRPDERAAIRKPRRWLFKLWVAVAILGGLLIMFGDPLAERFNGHGVVAIIDIAVVLFLTVTGLGWLGYLALSKRRTRRPDSGVAGDGSTPRRTPR